MILELRNNRDVCLAEVELFMKDKEGITLIPKVQTVDYSLFLIEFDKENQLKIIKDIARILDLSRWFWMECHELGNIDKTDFKTVKNYVGKVLGEIAGKYKLELIED